MNNDYNGDADINPKICPLSQVCAKTSFQKGELLQKDPFNVATLTMKIQDNFHDPWQDLCGLTLRLTLG